MLQIEKIEIIQKYFSNQPVENVYLFGSYARKEQNEDSDIDLLIELSKDAQMGLIQFSRMKIDIENILNQKVDILTKESISPFIIPFVQKDMLKIYEKSN